MVAGMDSETSKTEAEFQRPWAFVTCLAFGSKLSSAKGVKSCRKGEGASMLQLGS